MLIAVSGLNGFVGKYLKAFFEGSVIEISRKQLSSNILKDTPFADCIIHLAGKAHDFKKVSNPQEYYHVNFELTKTLYDAFLMSDTKKFIFISSVKAAADSVYGVLTESVIPSPQTHYGKSKLMAEEYIRSQPLPLGKSYYILRPCMIHGPGNKGNLNLLYNFVKKGIPYPLAGFTNKRSFLSVENLCFVINELIERDDIPSDIYQVADDGVLSTNDVVSILASSLKTNPKLWKISPSIIKLIAKIGDVLHLPLTSERLNKLTENYVVSNQKIKKALNKKFPLTAIEGLEITANSYNKV